MEHYSVFNKVRYFTSESPLLAKYGMLATALGAALCIYSLLLVVYRLYFDPLAAFPGPKIAAATGWYEFYYDVIRRGQYLYLIEEMHKNYGIVHLSPSFALFLSISHTGFTHSGTILLTPAGLSPCQ